MWSVVGIQGALTTSLGLRPVYLTRILIGNVARYEDLYGDSETIREDCQRAFSGRLDQFPLEGN
jgi:Adenosine-deaminase (editase) domain